VADGGLETRAVFLRTPIEDIVLIQRPHVIEPLEVLEIADVWLNQGQRMQATFCLADELDLVHLLLAHEELQQGTFGVNHTYHKAIGIEGEIVDQNIPLYDGMIHSSSEEVRVHDGT